jgi:hypothetical protein
MNNNLNDDLKASVIAAALKDEGAKKPWWVPLRPNMIDIMRKVMPVQSLPPGAFAQMTSRCEVCLGDSGECGHFIFVFLDYEKRCLASPEIKRMGDNSVAICYSCMITSNVLIEETVSRPLRDMPVLINDKNPFVREVARQRLKNNE